MPHRLLKFVLQAAALVGWLCLHTSLVARLIFDLTDVGDYPSYWVHTPLHFWSLDSGTDCCCVPPQSFSMACLWSSLLTGSVVCILAARGSLVALSPTVQTVLYGWTFVTAGAS